MTSRKAPAESRGIWAVKCWEYTSTFQTEAAARRHLATVEATGHCCLPHEVVRVDA